MLAVLTVFNVIDGLSLAPIAILKYALIVYCFYLNNRKVCWFMSDSNPFDGLLSFQDAAALYGKNDSTLRRAVADGRLVEGIDCKKFGKQWIVTTSAMRRLYGEPPQK